MGLVDKTTMNYVFIDEVQYVPEFERMLDSLFVKKYIDIYATGSNADMYSSKIATLLTGRYIEIKMQPLVFSEFVQFFPEQENRDGLFNKFIQYGGFPEVANMLVKGADSQAKVYLENVYQTILEKDVKNSKKVRNMTAFQNVADYLFDNVGNTISSNKIANYLASSGRKVDNETVEKYLGIMRDCYVAYEAKRYDIKGKMRLTSQSKYYAVDLGLANTVLGRKNDTDIGHQLENLVFLELKKRYRSVFVGKIGDREIDFRVQNEQGEAEYFQVSLSVMDETTRERELEPFRIAKDNYRRTLLTLDPLSSDEDGVRRQNIIEWLLS